MPGTTPLIGLFLEPLDTDTRHDVSQFGQCFRTVGIEGNPGRVDLEPGIVVLREQRVDPLVSKRFASDAYGNSVDTAVEVCIIVANSSPKIWFSS